MQIKLLTLASVGLMVTFASASPMSDSDAGLEIGSITDNSHLVRRVPVGAADFYANQKPPARVDPKLEDKLKQEKPEAQQFLAEFLDMLKQSGKMLDKKEDQDKLKSCASQ